MSDHIQEKMKQSVCSSYSCLSVSTKLQQLLDSFQRYWQFGMHDMTQPKWNDQCLGSMDVSLHAKH